MLTFLRNLLKNSWQLWQADVRIGKRWISFITVWKRWINWIKETKNYKAGQEVKENKFETFQIGLVSRICRIVRKKKKVSIDSFAPLFFLKSCTILSLNREGFKIFWKDWFVSSFCPCLAQRLFQCLFKKDSEPIWRSNLCYHLLNKRKKKSQRIFL